MENLVKKDLLIKCFEEYDDISPTIIDKMKTIQLQELTKLVGLIRNTDNAKKLWKIYFSDEIPYLDFINISRDDAIFFFLILEDNMELKAPSIWKIIKC